MVASRFEVNLRQKIIFPPGSVLGLLCNTEAIQTHYLPLHAPPC